MTFDWDKVKRSKEAYRRKLAALPFAEKLRIVEAMRERDRSIAASSLAQAMRKKREGPKSP